ncbi:MAG: acyltransferase [Tannerella sp.]|jgi:surface polysaccharide O-acyltransferase-like enzyme|nr:acyltransferase [Tannerella sp.]
MKNTNERYVWLDVLRFIAIFLVVCSHCCDPFNLAPDAKNNPDYGIWGALYGSFLRPCVPLFVMMTGLLLLPVNNIPPGKFYRKRILRVLVPFLIWSLLYNLFPWITGIVGGDQTTVGTFFPYSIAYGNVPSLGLSDALVNIARIPFNFSVYAVHMWYIYMLIGLYLFMPFFSAWIDKYSRKTTEMFLVIWGITLFLPYAYQYISTYFWGTCSWNAYGMLYYFAGFNGYLLLGYYLNRYNTLTLGKTILLAIPLFVIGYAVTYTGFSHMIANPESSEEMIELFWTYCSPNVLLMTIAVFMITQKVVIESSFWKKILANLTQCGLGIYMVHYFFVGVGFLAAQKMAVPVPLLIPVAAMIVFAFSWIIVSLVYGFIPKAARWILG